MLGEHLSSAKDYTVVSNHGRLWFCWQPVVCPLAGHGCMFPVTVHAITSSLSVTQSGVSDFPG